MKYQHRSKIFRSLTPEGLKRLLSWSNRKAQVLDILREIPHTEEFFGPERRIVETVRIPQSWSELREALRDLTPARNYGIDLIYYGKCKRCGSRFEATSMRKNYCSRKCIGKAAGARWYPIRLQRGDFKEAMARRREKEPRIAEARTAEQERLEARKLYREVVFGNLAKENPHLYNYILRRLGGDEAKGHKKITDWYNQKLKFEQLPAGCQKVFYVKRVE